jgi:hypothetical protein
MWGNILNRYKLCKSDVANFVEKNVLFITMIVIVVILIISYQNYTHTQVYLMSADIENMTEDQPFNNGTSHFNGWFSTITNSLGAIIGFLGVIFAALKYKLDRVNYHKELFDKRYEVFLEIEQILRTVFQMPDNNENNIWRNDLLSKLDAIWRRSYFLFGRKTYIFLERFRIAVIDKSHKSSPHKMEEAEQFLITLLDRQALSENFPELKIDNY